MESSLRRRKQAISCVCESRGLEDSGRSILTATGMVGGVKGRFTKGQ